MEVHQLRYFCAIVDTGSFSHAAEACHVSQPSLSQQVRKLEQELGAALFDRLPRGARLTPPGEALLPRARAALAELEQARSAVAERAGSLTGTLAIGIIPTIAPYWLPPALERFARHYPQASVHVTEDITPVLLDRLRSGQLELAVVALPLPRRGEFETERLLEEGALAVVPPGHRLARQDRIALRELRGEPFLLLRDGHCFRDTALGACRQARVAPRVVFESGQFSSILSMVSAGAGVSIVPAMAAEPRPGCRYIPLAAGAGRRTVVAAAPRGRFRFRLARAFLQEAAGVAMLK